MATATVPLSPTGPGMQLPCSCWATGGAGDTGTHGASAKSPCSVVFILASQTARPGPGRFPQTPTSRRPGIQYRLPYSGDALSFRRPASTTPRTPRARAAPLGRHPSRDTAPDTWRPSVRPDTCLRNVCRPSVHPDTLGHKGLNQVSAQTHF